MGSRMYRLIAFVMLSAASSVFSATITVGPTDCDYTTFASLFAGEDLAPGDVVEARAATPGGSVSFTETIQPGANDVGTEANPIVIQARSGDTVTIDGQATRNNCAVVTVDGIKLSGLVFTGALQTSICDNGGDYFTVDGCTIQIILTGSSSGQSRNGIVTVNNPTGVTISNNTIYTDDGTFGESQTDCILVGGSNIAITGNTIRMHNNEATGQHNDGIQTLNVTNLTITGNIVDRIIPSVTSTQGQAIYTEFYNYSTGTPTDYGTCLIRSNLVIGHGGSYLLHGYCRTGGAATSAPNVDFVIQNNTVDAYNISTSLPFRLAITGTNPGCTATIANNIFVERRTSGPHYIAAIDGSFTLTMDNDLLYSEVGTGDLFTYSGATYTFSEWQGLGYDANGAYGDPLFMGGGAWMLRSGSPAIGLGQDLSGSFTTDITGETWVTWGSGAYQYVEPLVGPDAPTSPTLAQNRNVGFVVAWTDASENEEQFDLRASTDGGSTWPIEITVPANTETYTYRVGTASTTYQVEVRATNGAGSSDWVAADPASVTTAAPAPVGRSRAGVGGLGLF